MKNIQKGSAKMLLLIIVLLIIGGGFYFVFYNNHKIIQKEINDDQKYNNSLSTYTHPDDLFSLKFPSVWEYSLIDSLGGSQFKTPPSLGVGPTISTVTTDVGDAIFDFIRDGNYIKTEGSFDKIDGYLVDVYTKKHNQYNQYIRIYVINIGQYKRVSVGVVFIVSVDSKIKESDALKKFAEVERVIKSIKINSDNIGNAMIKISLFRFRVISADLYYNNNKRSYLGFCTSEEYLKIEKRLSGLICRDSKENYVVSSPLVDGGFFCVDSTGATGNTKAMDTENACVK